MPGWVSPVVAGGTGGGGIWEETTARGAGFKMVVTDQQPSTWNPNTKNVLAQKTGVAALGSTEDWSFSFMLPSAGNPSGVPDASQGGVLWEFHTQSDSGHHLSIYGTRSAGGPRLQFRQYIPPWTPGSSYTRIYDPAGPLKFDHWYDVREQIKWSNGPDGILKFWLDGALMVDYTGITIKPGETAKLQFGFYSARQLSNEIHFAGISKN